MTQRTIRSRVISVFVATIIAAVTYSAGAQVLEEIIVTAQKREQNVQDVGIAITAFSGAQLKELRMTESTDVAYMSAGVFVSGSSGGQTREFTIRGVTQNDFSDVAENPNATYVDEGYIGFRQGNVFAAFDLERVEILKGPQGTLFGRNATGGAVAYHTKKPTEETEGFLDLTYGRENTFNVEGAISGSLNDRVRARLSGMYKRHDPILNNVFPLDAAANPAGPGSPPWFGSATSDADDVWNDNQWAIRGQLEFDVTDNVQFLVSGFAGRAKIGTSPKQHVATTGVRIDSDGDGAVDDTINSIFAADDPLGCEVINGDTGGCLPVSLTDGEFFPGPPLYGPSDNVRPVVGGDFWGHIDPDGTEGFDISSDMTSDDFNRNETEGVTAKITWDINEDMTLTSVSHYMHFLMRESIDVESSPVAQGAISRDTTADNFAQELRLNGQFGRVDYVAGLYYLWMETNDRNGFDFSEGGPLTTALMPFLLSFYNPFGVAPFQPGGAQYPGALASNNIVDLETNSYSIFGQMDIELTNEFELILGARVVFEDKDYDYVNEFYGNLDDFLVEFDNRVPVVIEFAPFSDSTSETLWTGKAQLNYRPNDDWLLYFGVNRGVKAGSFNGPVNAGQARLADDQFPYDSEVLLAYEGGFKATLFGGSTRLNASAYYYDYSDYQAFLFIGASGAIFNNDATYKGVELELLSSPIDNFTFMFNASYIDAEIEGLAIAPSVERDVEPAFTPDVQLSGLARYEWPDSLAGGTVAIQAEFDYAAHRFQNIRNFDAQRMPSYVMGDVRAYWTSADERWELSAFVENVADERAVFSGFDLSTLCGCTTVGFYKPRWWGIRARYNYF